jgi:GAF domain-containing protein
MTNVPANGGEKLFSYAEICEMLAALIAGETNRIAIMANTAALLFQTLPEVNWVGFYLYDGGELVLGPFQGKPACMRIGMGRGVCGTAALELRTILVDDVHAFPGHIACDADSRSEIVAPLLQGQNLLGVLDLDSPRVARFTLEDKSGIEAAAAVLLNALGASEENHA